MIEQLSVDNLANGASIVLNDNTLPLNRFQTDVDLRLEQRERPLQHGLFPTNTYYGRRLFVCEGNIIGNGSADYMTTRLNLQRALQISDAAGFRVPFRLRLRWTGVPEEMVSYVTLDGWPSIPMQAGWVDFSEFQVSFMSFDPLLYGATVQSAAMGTPNITQTVAFPGSGPLPFPINFTGLSGASSQANVTNSGNTASSPVVKITGPTQSPYVTKQSGDSPTVGFDGLTLGAGETLEVNFSERTAFTTAGANVYDFVNNDNEWWTLDPGNNSVVYGAFSASPPSGATIEWRNAYMI